MSYSSMDQASYPSNRAFSSSSTEITFSFSQIMEGYDNEFVPHPESRYECPICLLVLREPCQTRCGHRFCRDCITRSMRDSSNRCPVDNEPLHENDIYPDNFAKREILNFDIKCPNNKDGCDKIFPLGKLQNHLEECPYALMPCPYKCSCIMQRIDMGDHLITSCENRVISCEHCHNEFRARDLQDHWLVCPNFSVECPYCNEKTLRKQMNFHLESECQLLEVECPFYLIGCNHRMIRSSVDEHILHTASSHMKQLCHMVTHMAQKLGVIQFTSETASKGSLENLQSLHQEQNSFHTWSNPLNLTCGETLMSPETVLSQTQPAILSQVSKREGNSLSISSGETPVSFDERQHRVTVTQYQSSEAADMMNSDSASDTGVDHIQRPSSSQVPRAKLPVRRLNYQPVTSTTLSFAEKNFPFHTQNPDSGQENLKLMKVIQEMNCQIEAKEAVQQQKFFELQSKFNSFEQLNSDLVKKMKNLEEQLVERDARFYNGDFCWSINKFSYYQAKLAAGEGTMLHSPPFYTNPWGYKMCIRANIDKSPDTGPNLSLFVHFMKGRNDSFLTWPFSGKITVSVMDQNPDPSKRVNMKETLIANPNLAAFQRPTAPRNHKGFGYIDFLSIAALENGSFLADDTLVIRVQVLDSSA